MKHINYAPITREKKIHKQMSKQNHINHVLITRKNNNNSIKKYQNAITSVIRLSPEKYITTRTNIKMKAHQSPTDNTRVKRSAIPGYPLGYQDASSAESQSRRGQYSKQEQSKKKERQRILTKGGVTRGYQLRVE